ncbi:Hypothetical predicted protein [Mytilus galloprovincialis]|uniref:Sulfotransferase domain-containing protein n=1 Tax=Mytilus galloprovincialis TaxID=29158 RepID=A0A8B6CRP9_MYTGA|nr:Hypothetical predicted protein [Mytilus galloprovincialis]
MSIQEFKDCDDMKIRVWVDNGHYFPEVMAARPDHLKELQSWETRHDDVLVCTYPKSGTLWLWDIVSLLISNQSEVLDRVFDTSNLELNGTEKLDELQSPRVLQSHMTPHFLPKSIIQKKNKIIYGIRNPRDVAVSMYHFMLKLHDSWSSYKGSWDNFLKLFQTGTLGYGSWYEHVKGWEELQLNKEHPVLFVSYEDLHRDCFKEVKKISEFLDLSRTDDTIHGIVKNTQFDNFKAEKLKSVGHKLTAISKDGKDPYFRKGIVGDWKNTLSDEQSEEFEQTIVQKQGKSNLIRRYTKGHQLV